MSKLTTTLAWPFLAPDVRLRLRHQRLGSRRGMRITPVSPWTRRKTMVGNTPIDRWLRSGAMEWEGQRVTIIGSLRTGTWIPGEGGLVPDFDAAEVARALVKLMGDDVSAERDWLSDPARYRGY